MTEPTPVQIIRNNVIDAAKAGALSWGVATAIDSFLQLVEQDKKDEVMLVERVLGGGADPASLAYLMDGHVPEKINLAHYNGPSVFKLDDPDRQGYLRLCFFSEDEAQDSTVRSRVRKLGQSLMCLGAFNEPDSVLDRPWDSVALEQAAEQAEERYLAIPFAVTGMLHPDRRVRVYAQDGGHAQGVWDRDDPQTATALYGVFHGAPFVGLCAPIHAPSLEEQGFDPEIASKQKSPRFWIVENEAILAAIRAGMDEANIEYPKVTS